MTTPRAGAGVARRARTRSSPGCRRGRPDRRRWCTPSASMPGRAPDPEQVEQAASLVRWIVVSTPCTAPSKDSCRSASRSAPRLGTGATASAPGPAAPPRPKRPPNRSPISPRSPMLKVATRRSPLPKMPAIGPRLANLVVLLALVLVAEHVVGGRDLLEPLLGGGVAAGWRRGGAAVPACRYAALMSFCEADSACRAPRSSPSRTTRAAGPRGPSPSPSPWPDGGPGRSRGSPCAGPRPPPARRRRPARAARLRRLGSNGSPRSG